MNHDVPDALAAARSRAADLEQQLRLSDEGVSRLAERCLALEKQVFAYQAAFDKHSSETDSTVLYLPQLFYDPGTGLSQQDRLTVTEEAYNELTHEVSAVFILPTDARALRLDPGDLPCCVTDLNISDDQMELVSANGITLEEGSVLFPEQDPNLNVVSSVPFTAGMMIAVNYHYYPLDHLLDEQPGKSLLRALEVIKLQADAKQKQAEAIQKQLETSQKQYEDNQKQIEAAREQVEAAREQALAQLAAANEEIAKLKDALQEVKDSQAAYETSLETVYESTSWKLTAPLRALRSLLRG